MNEITLYNKVNNPIDAISELGEFFAKSGMFGCDRIEQGKVLAMTCLAENKSPTEIMRTYHIVEGKLSKKAGAALAEFRQKGGRHKWLDTGDSGDDSAQAVGKFTDPDGETLKVSFSMAQARKQGLVKPRSAWETVPGNMLRARVISNAIGMLMPEIFAGGEESNASPAPPKMATEVKVSESPADELLGSTPKQAKPFVPPPPSEELIKAATKEPESEPEPEAVDAEIVPAPPVKPEEPKLTPFKAKPSADGGIDHETVLALTEVFTDPDAAFAHLMNKKWIVVHLKDLSAPRAQKILNKPDAFNASVEKALAKGGKE